MHDKSTIYAPSMAFKLDARLSVSYARLSWKHDERWQILIYFVTSVITNTVHLAIRYYD